MYYGSQGYKTASETVYEALEAQGFGLLEYSQPHDEILLPRHEMGFSSSGEYIACLKSYEFRKLLRYLIDKKSDGPFAEDHLGAKLDCDLGKLQKYLTVLSRRSVGLAKCQDGRWSLAVDVDSFGPTLEWYVAHKFNNELHWRATHGVRLEGVDFNDYDVVAVRNSEIAVVECKAADPGGITKQDIRNFYNRHTFLNPVFSLLLVDTSAVGKLAGLAKMMDDYFKGSCRETQEYTGGPASAFDALPGSKGYLFQGWGNLYLGGTKMCRQDGILCVLRCCLRHHHGPPVHRLPLQGVAPHIPPPSDIALDQVHWQSSVFPDNPRPGESTKITLRPIGDHLPLPLSTMYEVFFDQFGTEILVVSQEEIIDSRAGITVTFDPARIGHYRVRWIELANGKVLTEDSFTVSIT